MANNQQTIFLILCSDKFSPSLMLSTIASIAVTFTVGAIAAWGPQYVFLGRQIVEDNSLSFDE